MQSWICLVLAVLIFAVGGYVVSVVSKDYRLQKYKAVWELVRSKAADWIVTIRYGSIDLENYNGVDYVQKAADLATKLGHDVDPRMAFLMDRIEDEVLRPHGVKIELEEVYAAAERKYNELRYAPNGMYLNERDAPKAPVVPPTSPTK